MCAVTFTSATPGQVTGHALELADSRFGAGSDHACRRTATGQNGSDAVKTFVDARIHITPDATNRVGAPHTFTAPWRRTSVSVAAGLLRRVRR